MNAPAKRFSLQRLLTSPPPPAPAPVDLAPSKPAPAPLRPAEPPALAVLIPEIAPPSPRAAVSIEAPAPLRTASALPPRAPEAALEDRHPKKKRSYSVDMKLCEDLEILSWYLGRSSSSVVEELIRRHLQHNKSVLLKAREIRSAR